MNRDKLIKLREKNDEISLFVNRINPTLKRDFKNLASAEFCDDFGQTLYFLYQQAMEYQSMKAMFFDKLQNMENKIDELLEKNTQLNKQEKRPEIKTLGRKELKGGGKN